MTLLLLLALPAWAQERVEYSLWSWTGVEGVPGADARGYLRAEEQIGLGLELPGGWRAGFLGAARESAAGDRVDTLDLYRAELARDSGPLSWQAGRLARPGVQGIRHLDGAALDAELGGGFSAAAWAGRSWHPELSAPTNTLLAGAELGLGAPGRSRFAARTGYELRVDDLDFAAPNHRLHAFAAASRARGGGASLLGELDPLAVSDDPGEALRGALRGDVAAGRWLDLGAGARWEGLAPVSQPLALASPMTWLAPGGYAAADVDARVQYGDWALTASGGPAWHPDEAPGGYGRAGIGWQVLPELRVGAGASGGAIGESWVAGGVGELSTSQGPVHLATQAGWFRFAPLSGPAAGVWEARGRLSMELPAPEGDALTLITELATGSDRTLESWVRGGLTLRAVVGGAR